MELLIQERATPLSYLSLDDATMTENRYKTREAGIFREAEYSTDGWIIKGKVNNTATLARFKDIVLTVKFYSQTQTEIESKDFIIYEFYEPSKRKRFELKVYPPDAHKTFSISIKSATPAD